RHHQLDLLVDVRSTPRYWANELSAKSYAAEQILLQQYNRSPSALQRDSISGQSIRYVDWLVPGILGMNIMFSSLWGVGWVVVRYRKNGVLRRLRATPLTASEFLIAQIISRLMIVVIVNVLVFAGTLAILDFPMRGSYLALLLVLLSGAIALISLGLAIAARVSSEELASGLLNVFAVPMMILSGVWFSVDASNIWVQRIADCLPLTHMVEAARRIMLDGASIGDVMFEIILLTIMALVLLVGSAKAFRWQ
ncbi:MAG: ABC transporter permease, partial [Gammaproteobacteria bacterium]|nr:ABC transporter permease [Gammaproteobacteria bacterium]